MRTAAERLTQLQAKINQANMPHWSLDDMRRLCVFEVAGLLHVHYYGLTHREYLTQADREEELERNRLPIFEVLSEPEVAGRVASLTFDGPDEGAEGTREWDFDWLLAQNVTFPELKTLVIRPSPLEAFNVTVIGGSEGNYEENGALAKWLSKAPKLSDLTTPSAPSAEFFEVAHEPLYRMKVEAGYDAQDFILNLSRKPMPVIAILDWSELHNWEPCDWEEGATPFEHFEALFSSLACPGYVTLRNPKLTDEQVRNLAALQRESCRGQATSLRVFYTCYGMDISGDGEGFWREREPSGRWRNSEGNEGDC